MKKPTQTRYFQSYTDDFIESKNQAFQLPNDYVWINSSWWHRAASRLLYLPAFVFSYCCCRFYLHPEIKNHSVLKALKSTGYFLYGNHTQPLGDAVIPIRLAAAKRCYILVDPANMGIPVLGRLLPLLGALPVPDSLAGLRNLQNAIGQRAMNGNCIAIYPEAHVWPWYTGIRPYSAVSFSYPVKYNLPSFCMTITYQQRKHRRKPKMTIYLDGPFYPDSLLSVKKQKEQLHREIYRCMNHRSKNSNFDYVQYKKGGCTT